MKTMNPMPVDVYKRQTFGKNLYAVGGNPEAAAVSCISVFAVTLGAFVMADVYKRQVRISF